MYKNQKIFILGMARSGYEVAKVLLQRENDVTITDQKEQDQVRLEEISSMGAKFILSDEPANYLDETFNLVVKNPGIDYNHPVCQKAESLGIRVINEMELVYNILPKDVYIIGITGSNGKTTTATLTYEMMRKTNKRVHLGGNIGIPFAAMLKDIQEGDVLVLEISAQQIHNFYDFHPNLAIITNITPTHLDFFHTFENYIEHKTGLLKNQTEKDIAVINMDDEVSSKINDIKAKKVTFSTTSNTDIYLKDDFIVYKGEKIINTSDIKIKGNHNIQNIMCAIIASKEHGVSNDSIKEVLTSFIGVEHRIEFVKELNKREFYNDSKSTNVIATETALSAFKKDVILLLGGLDRQHSFAELESYLKVVKTIVAYGETKNRIKEFATSINKECIVVDTLEEATKRAYSVSSEGDTILLSPACASWDQFKDYEERGRSFKKYINELEEII